MSHTPHGPQTQTPDMGTHMCTHCPQRHSPVTHRNEQSHGGTDGEGTAGTQAAARSHRDVCYKQEHGHGTHTGAGGKPRPPSQAATFLVTPAATRLPSPQCDAAAESHKPPHFHTGTLEHLKAHNHQIAHHLLGEALPSRCHPHTRASFRDRAGTKPPLPGRTDPGAAQSQSRPYSCLLPLTLPFRAGPRSEQKPQVPSFHPPLLSPPAGIQPLCLLSLSHSPGRVAGTLEPRLPGVPVAGQARVVPARAAVAGQLGEGVA